MEQLVILAFGIILGAFLKSYFDKSNKIFELKLDALNNIWIKFNELTDAILSKGVEEAEKIISDFRKEVNRGRILLDYHIIDDFLNISEASSVYINRKEEDKPGKWRLPVWKKEIERILKNLTEKINKSLFKNKCKIKLDFPKSTDETGK